MPAPSLAERYVAEGYDLERLPLPAPFDFLATGKDRVAAFASAERVPASVLVDVRLMARELGAKAVFVAASFSDEARRIADRFGIELVITPPRESEAHAPVAPPPEAGEMLPLTAGPPVGITTHDFDEFPTPDELREELAEINSVLDPRPLTPAQATEVALAEAATVDDLLALHAAPQMSFLPREIHTHVEPRLQVAEAALSHPVTEDIQEDLAAWYEELCMLEAADRMRDAFAADDLADWYDALLELESDTLAAEAAEESAFSDLAPLALHGHGALAPPVEFAPPPAAAEVFRDVEAAVPVLAEPVAVPEVAPVVAEAPAPFPELVWSEVEELAPMAHAGRVLAAEPHFGAPDRGAVAFRTVEDAAPELPSFAFTVPTPEPVEAVEAPVVETPVEAPKVEEPETFTQVESPFLNPASVLPWTPNAPMPVAGYVPPTPAQVLGSVPQPPAEIIDAETGAIAAIDTPTPAPRAMLPWTPSVRGPATGADPALFADAFAKAQAWNTVQRIEGIRQQAHEAVVQASDAPKPKAVTQIAHDTDFELL